MKNPIITMAAMAFLVTGLLAGCNSPAQKLENAEEEVTAANKKLETANEEYLADLKNYRLATAERIAENDESIARFKLRIANEKKETRDEYNKKIIALEQKNSDNKKRLDDYKTEGKANWEIFKTEFSRDMDELGTAIRNLTTNNTK